MTYLLVSQSFQIQHPHWPSRCYTWSFHQDHGFLVGLIGGGNWGTLRISREDWGTLGKISGFTTTLKNPITTASKQKKHQTLRLKKKCKESSPLRGSVFWKWCLLLGALLLISIWNHKIPWDFLHFAAVDEFRRRYYPKALLLAIQCLRERANISQILDPTHCWWDRSSRPCVFLFKPW